eukprot:maker-scaffold1394_size43558-snap-gene-0.8 protein:Tk04388 transcript:maker-scaffold1394_size43558-snap-gene-0.8-mRNA-1 annotation:"protein fam173b"
MSASPMSDGGSEKPCPDCVTLQKEFQANPGGKKMSTTGWVLLGVTGGTAVALSAICLPFVTPALRRVCLPYVPATTAQVENVYKALSGRRGTLVDIGSGDGRIVFEGAQRGFLAHGIELNPWLVLYSKFKSRRLGLKTSATFTKRDLWQSNLGKYDNVVIFGVQEMMPQLEGKLAQELAPNASVVACRFPFPNWLPKDTIGEGIDTVWIYKPK